MKGVYRMEALIHNFLINLPTILLILVGVFSLFTLSKGADILVNQAVSLSIRWGVPKIIIGATIVSLGTTLPEASVSVLAAVNGNPDLALGNAVGSIIADTGLIIGLASLLGQLPLDKGTVDKQGRIQYLAGVLLVLVSLPFLSPGPGGNISQAVGIMFLVLLASYIYYSIKLAKKTPAEDISLDEVPENPEDKPLIIQLILLVLGIGLVILSSKVLIPTVEIGATRVGIPQSIIAATLVAFGTSLPELITAVTAVRKGHGELAIGNIIGADILNVLFVVGGAAAATSGGLAVPSSFYKLQFPTMLIILFAFRYFSKKGSDIDRKEGIFLLGMYVIYIILNYTWI